MHNSGYTYNIITMTKEIKAHLIKAGWGIIVKTFHSGTKLLSYLLEISIEELLGIHVLISLPLKDSMAFLIAGFYVPVFSTSLYLLI